MAESLGRMFRSKGWYFTEGGTRMGKTRVATIFLVCLVSFGFAFSAIHCSAQQAQPPTLSPAGGSYSSVQFVTISDAIIGATSYYTTDGSTPTTSSAMSANSRVAQVPSAPRNPKPMTVITTALNAVGGQVTFKNINDLTSTGSCSPIYTPTGDFEGVTYGNNLALCHWYDGTIRVIRETDTGDITKNATNCSAEQGQ